MRYLLIAVIVILILCLDVALRGEELPCPMRLPTPMFQTDDCDCEGCCCAPLCKCTSLDYDVALQKAIDEQKPIVVYLNTRPHPVEGCIVTRVKSFPGVDFNVGVIIGTPLSWENDHDHGMRLHLALFGPRYHKQIHEIIQDHKRKLKVRHSWLGIIPRECPPNG